MRDFTLEFSPEKVVVLRIAIEVEELGGKTYYVGGCVRDWNMDHDSKDLDIEVHGITTSQLEGILDKIGERIEVGASFGVYKLRGYDLDISMPRVDFASEVSQPRGHKDFKVLVNPFVGERAAASRRDFTVNALMMNACSGEVLDFFGGREDIKNKILRHVSDETFAEDPLRVLRGAQFAARLEFEIAEETRELSRSVNLSALSCERVMGELEKALLKANRPSVFFTELCQMGQLSYWFPEVEALIGVEQGKKHHAEGDVFAHTMLVLDEAASRRDKALYPLGYMMSALTHDFGKAVTTTKDSSGHIRTNGHDLAGEEIAERFLKRLTHERKLITYVKSMTKLHMRPLWSASQEAAVSVTNKLYDKSVCPEDLILLCEADTAGRIHEDENDRSDYTEFLTERLRMYRERMEQPEVRGQDLIDAGISPGAGIGKALKFSHGLHLSGFEKDEALRMTISYVRAHEVRKRKRK